MKVPWSWLQEYVELPCDVDEAVKRFTMTGLKVEDVKREKLDAHNVFTARILKVTPHPKVGHLKVGVLTTGSSNFTVVSGAPSFEEGRVVALALPGAVLPSGEFISPRDFHGIVSEGMVLCSNELLTGQGPRPGEDIILFPEDQTPGVNVIEVLGLDDWVIDLELTVNMSHCLSMIGVAIEASAMFGVPLKLPPSLERWSFAGPLGSVEPSGERKNNLENREFKVVLHDPDLCPRYVGKVVSGVKNGYSPVKIERRLLLSGMRPVNAIVDATNYIMLETGQPLHAFDADKIRGKVIFPRRSLPGESIVTLDGQQRPLNPGTLVIADAKGPIAIAGVMGGLDSEITPDTRRIFIESAYFNPLSVRTASQRHNLRTEAAIRFEKGIDPTAQVSTVERVAEFIESLGLGTPEEGWVEANDLDVSPKRIALRNTTVKRYLWLDIGTEKCRQILTSLRFKVEENGDSLLVTVPPRRVDIQEEVDLLEEIARYYGYDVFPAKDMDRALPGGPPDREFQVVDKIKDFLVSMGGFEVITNSLLSPEDLKNLGWDEDDRRGQPVALKNPLSSWESVLRTSLLPGLLKVVGVNERAKTPGGMFFEVGNVFFKSKDDTLPEEVKMLGLASYGTMAPKTFMEDQRSYSFFHMKGVIDELLRLLGIEEAEYYPGASKPFHPGKSAKILVKGSQVGEIGEMHPLFQKILDLPLTPILAWLAVPPILSLSREARYEEIPRFMPVERDISVIVPEEVPAGEVIATVKKSSDKLSSVSLFDVWRKDPVPPGMKSIAMRLLFQPWHKPFTEEELSLERDKIMFELKERFGARER